MWPVTLSGRLPVTALVGHHPTNKLIGREPIPHQKNLSNPHHAAEAEYPVLDPVSQAYPKEEGRLLTYYSPVRHSSTPSKLEAFPFDLHVLSTPPAFVLSQDQTLHKKPKNSAKSPKRLKQKTKNQQHHQKSSTTSQKSQPPKTRKTRIQKPTKKYNKKADTLLRSQTTHPHPTPNSFSNQCRRSNFSILIFLKKLSK